MEIEDLEVAVAEAEIVEDLLDEAVVREEEEIKEIDLINLKKKKN